MRNTWTQQDIPDLTGTVIVITGANSGLGYEAARTLAGKGATLVLAVRTSTKGEQAKAAILQVYPHASLDMITLDVANLRSVRDFAAAFQANYDRLDILINNAGVMAIPRQETADGFEMQLGVNHLGHFALTGLLIDLIVKTPRARIHNVTSSANFFGTINFDDLMSKKRYSRWGAYGQSKLANVFFTFELQKRLTAAGFDTIANTSHPGLVLTNLQANSVAQSGTGYEGFLYRMVEPILAQDISMGILPMLYGATAPEAKGGVLYGPRTFNLRGHPAEARANKQAYDATARTRFWDMSEELTGVTFDIFKQSEVYSTYNQ